MVLTIDEVLVKAICRRTESYILQGIKGSMPRYKTNKRYTMKL